MRLRSGRGTNGEKTIDQTAKSTEKDSAFTPKPAESIDFPQVSRGSLYSYEVYGRPTFVAFLKDGTDTQDYCFRGWAFEGTGQGAAPSADDPRSILAGKGERSRMHNKQGDEIYAIRPSRLNNVYPEFVLSDGQRIRPHRVAIDHESPANTKQTFTHARLHFFCWEPDDGPYAESSLEDQIHDEPRGYCIIQDRVIYDRSAESHESQTVLWRYQLTGNDKSPASQTFSENRLDHYLLERDVEWEQGEFLREPGSDLLSLWSSSWKHQENLPKLPEHIEDTRDPPRLDPYPTVPTIVHHFLPHDLSIGTPDQGRRSRVAESDTGTITA